MLEDWRMEGVAGIFNVFFYYITGLVKNALKERKKVVEALIRTIPSALCRAETAPYQAGTPSSNNFCLIL